MVLVDVVCPDSATAGDTIAVTSDTGAAFDVVVPGSVGPGVGCDVVCLALPHPPERLHSRKQTCSARAGVSVTHVHVLYVCVYVCVCVCVCVQTSQYKSIRLSGKKWVVIVFEPSNVYTEQFT